MLAEPNCFKRNCRHFQGVKQDGEREVGERPVCEAFPDGIPKAICYGNNLHLNPYPGDRGIRYERE